MNSNEIALISRKPRRDDRLSNLSECDRQKIAAWLQTMGYDDAVIQIAKPQPEGLGLKTSRSALGRFYHKQSLAENLNLVLDAVQAASPTPEAFESMIGAMVQAHVTNTAEKPELQAIMLPHLLRYVARSRDQRLRQRALDLRETPVGNTHSFAYLAPSK